MNGNTSAEGQAIGHTRKDQRPGKVWYGYTIPGLLTAVVSRSPVFGGKVKSIDATKTKTIPGVRQVVTVPSGVAVIADHFWAAKQGRDALESGMGY